MKEQNGERKVEMPRPRTGEAVPGTGKTRRGGKHGTGGRTNKT